MPDIVATKISKTFRGRGQDGQLAVRDVSFVVPDGQFTAVLGPSGCGKSTTLRIVAGLETPDAGTVSIGGRDVTGTPSSERGLAMVFQNYALFPHLDVANNILFGLSVRRVPRRERAARLAEVARQLRLEPYLHRKPSQLSGGQRQRVALGRALVSGSRVILMDEPLSNLDAQLRLEMRGEIRDLQQRLELTILYVTHDQVEAMTMADHVIVMREGVVEQIATAEELYSRPASVEVARFIGSPPMNLLPVVGQGAAVGLTDGSEVPVPDLTRWFPQLPDRLILGIRPEDVVPGVGEVTLPAHLIRSELLGADRLLHFEVAGNPLVARVKANLRIPDSRVVSAAARDVHLFSAENQQRIPSSLD